MQRVRGLENSRQPAQDRGAESSAPRSTPLTLVAGAVAGDDLGHIATTVAEALGCPVAIAIPALGEPVIGPPGSVGGDEARAIAAHAAALVSEGRVAGEPVSGEPVSGDSASGERATVLATLADVVPVQIGRQTVGIAVTVGMNGPRGHESTAERRAWLEAAAAAASVTALIRDAHGLADRDWSRALLAELAAGIPDDPAAFLARAGRLGLELSEGAVAICARRSRSDDGEGPVLRLEDRRLVDDLQAGAGALVAELAGGHIVAVAPLGAAGSREPAEHVAGMLRARGLTVAMSGPSHDPALLHQAVHEAQLLVELGSTPDVPPAGQEETYRLLVRVLLRGGEELKQLRDQTITPLAGYDARHDTELLATLRAFLAHDGSTTETADAMSLHRHTVGYRLSRVHEVSGLSPYESDGRERLGLGIKAHEILEAQRRLWLLKLNQ